MPRKIDSHCHVWPGDAGKWPVKEGVSASEREPEDYAIETHLSALGALGVEAAVIVPHIGFYGRDLSYALDSARQFPDRVAVLGAITAAEVENPALLSGDLLNDVRAFRLRAVDMMGAADHLFGWMAEHRAIVCPLITAAQPEALEKLDDIAAAHPNLKIVIDHFGGAPGAPFLRDLAKYKNVFVKVAGFNTFDTPPYPRSVAAMLDLLPEYGADRLMWGSDMPIFALGKEHELLLAFKAIDEAETLSASDRDALMGGTADRLFFDRKA